MKKLELQRKISNGEDSYTQFKLNITNSDKLAGEFVAFSNARGGMLFIGVNDTGQVIGLENVDIRRINQLIGNVINSKVFPPIYPLVKIEDIDNKKVIIIEIDEGVNKPYSTNNGIYLTKAGSDKRKISPQELRRLFATSKNIYSDEEIVRNTTINDIDIHKLKKYLKIDNPDILSKLNNNDLELKSILTNLELYKNNSLTLAGNLLFGKEPQRFSPSFYVDCCYFDGNDVSVTKFISKKTINGTFDEIYEDSMRFIVSQLRSYQVEKDFNSNPKLEIHKEILTELIINALLHRDYYINSSIKIFIFYNRIEIITPGKLTNSLTVEKIKNGIAIHRNPVLNSISKKILPYTGYGTGIKRVLKLDPTIEFINDIDMEQFKSIIYREKLSINDEKLGDNKEKLGDNKEKLGDNKEKLGDNKLSERKKMILSLIKQNKNITIDMLSKTLEISSTAVEKHLKILKDKKYLVRIGTKNGYWEIKKD